jgi:phage FluMu protein Com
MAIDFRCPRCDRLLRTDDDTAGKQAKCPQCGTVMMVPTGAAAFPEQTLPTQPPVHSGAAPLPPVFPQSPHLDPRGYALGRVSGPAVALMVLGVLSAAAAFGAMFGAVHLRFNFGNFDMFAPATRVPSAFVDLAASVMIVIGAAKMKQLENYSLAMAAAILAITPCIGPCCCLGLPLGIWALTVLSEPQVKSSFTL